MPDASEPVLPNRRMKYFSDAEKTIPAITGMLVGSCLPISTANAQQVASQQAMALYTKIGSLNVCIYRAAGIPFDKATAIAGETVAQAIKGVNGGKISELGEKSLSIEELRKGAINTVVLGSVEVCPNEVPLAIREKAKNTLATRSDVPIRESPESDKGKNTQQESITSAINPAQLAAAITVRVETSGPSGSGAILSRQGDKYNVATACHVIDGSSIQEEVQIITADNVNHKAVRPTAKRHRDSDLCTLSFTSKSSYTAPLVASKRPEVGDSIYVAGWSLSSKDVPSALRVIQGVITGSTQALGQDGYSLIYTTSAPTLPGMSGGPVISENQLVGIHGRAERAPDVMTDGKIMATSYSLGLSIELLEKSSFNGN